MNFGHPSCVEFRTGTPARTILSPLTRPLGGCLLPAKALRPTKRRKDGKGASRDAAQLRSREAESRLRAYSPPALPPSLEPRCSLRTDRGSAIIDKRPLDERNQPRLVLGRLCERYFFSAGDQVTRHCWTIALPNITPP